MASREAGMCVITIFSYCYKIFYEIYLLPIQKFNIGKRKKRYLNKAYRYV